MRIFLGMLNGRYAMYPGQVERAPFLSLFYKILSQTSCFFRFKCSNPHGLINRKIHSLDRTTCLLNFICTSNMLHVAFLKKKTLHAMQNFDCNCQIHTCCGVESVW